MFSCKIPGLDSHKHWHQTLEIQNKASNKVENFMIQQQTTEKLNKLSAKNEYNNKLETPINQLSIGNELQTSKNKY
ncbi:1258_t:CDS:2 [Cetraspora pellucida]|uniref:1258_t:CDS:1 n=1 Tax=Cetraspora pellucida TaxID=1433469 RepID=A0ACA9P3A2_9GLOM|nr:1258_t:CDS:2 [Cetraspora pellucida]